MKNMIRRSALLFMSLSVLAFAVVACSGTNGPSGGSGEGKGRVVFTISDAAADMGAVTEVSVTVESIRVQGEGSAWVNVASNAKTYDLLELRADQKSELFAEAQLEAGTYNQIELNISKVVVVDDKGEHDAKLPSGKLHLKGQLEVVAGSTSSADFDFIADESLHVTGQGRYIFAPVIQLETRASAEAEIKSGNKVVVTGGRKTTDVKLGMNVDGNIDAGVKIKPNAILNVSGDGAVTIGGHSDSEARISGSIKAVDVADNTVTIVTDAGSEVTLKAADSGVVEIDGKATTLADLTTEIGSEIEASYDVETRTATTAEVKSDSSTEAGADAGARATASASGTLKSFNALTSMVTIVTESGEELALKIKSDTKIVVNGSAAPNAQLLTMAGSKVDVKYDVAAKAITMLEVKA